MTTRIEKAPNPLGIPEIQWEIVDLSNMKWADVVTLHLGYAVYTIDSLQSERN